MDRPNMLGNFGEIFFHNKVSAPFSNWFLHMGLKAASWSTIQVAYAWLSEVLFNDLSAVKVPTLILHGIHDQVCLFQLSLAQKQGIKGSVLIPFENSGHGLFYDEKQKFNRELINFLCYELNA